MKIMHISNVKDFFNKLSGRLLLALTFIALLSVGGLGLADYLNEREVVEMQVKAQLISIADLKKNRLLPGWKSVKPIPVC